MAYRFTNPTNKKEYLFIHIPKTGGTSIGHTLSDSNQFDPILGYEDSSLYTGHLSLRDIREVCNTQDDIDNLIVFATVRNPFSWYVSWYSFLQSYASSDYAFIRESEMVKKPFNDFVLEISQNRKDLVFLNGGKNTPKYQQMVDWLSLSTEEDIKIIKMEDMAKDKHLLQEIGLNVKTGAHKNKSVHKHYTTYYDTDTVKIVEGMHLDDLKVFGYTFGD